MKTRSSQAYFLFLLSLILFSFVIRSIGWDDPHFGHHVERQLNTLSIIENYVDDGIKLLEPSAFYFTYWEHTLLELPIYQGLSAWISGFTKAVLSTSRGLNLFFALITLLVVFKIAAIQFTRETAIYSVLFFAFSPLNLMYQSAVLFDISSVFFALLAYWMVAKYIQGKRSKALFFIFLLAGLYSVLTKPLYFLPAGVLFITHFLQQFTRPRIKNFLDYIVIHRLIIGMFVLITFVMFLWVSLQTLINSAPLMIDSVGRSVPHNSLGFLSYQHLYDAMFYIRTLFRGILLILNPVTFLFFTFGILLLYKNHRGSQQMALIYSIIWYHVIFGTQIDPHEYYELIMVPFASIIAGSGASWISEKMRSEFKITSRHMLSAAIILTTALCSFFLYSINFIGSLNLEHRTYSISQEIQDLLDPKNYAYIYVDQTNFPIADYVLHNRTAKLMYFAGFLSKNEVRSQSEPLKGEELMYELKQYGDMNLILSGQVPEIDIQKVKLRYKKTNKNLRYLMFYRFTKNTKSVIKNRITDYKIIYESSNWLIYDLIL
jgi:hypothetical protein